MSINPENIRRVIDQIRAEPARFDMNIYVGVRNADGLEDRGHEISILDAPCGTVACIAGWAAYLSGSNPTSTTDMLEAAAEFLGLPPEAPLTTTGFSASEHLFYGWLPHETDRPRNRPYLSSFTPEDAIQVLEHLIETGEVDWSIVETRP